MDAGSVVALAAVVGVLEGVYKRKGGETLKMDNNEQNIQYQLRHWHYWWLVTFSLLLIITFVYYLPLRFLHTTATDGGHMMEDMREDGMDDMHGHDAALYHEEHDITEGLAVNFTAIPPLPSAGATTTLSFYVNEKPDGIGVPASYLEIGHEKLMHVIGVRNDMNEFFHIHPMPTVVQLEPIEGVFRVDYVFDKPGHYKIWSEIKKDGVTHTYGHEPIEVKGEGLTDEKRVSFVRSVVVGGYQVVLDAGEPVEKGVEHDLSFDIHDSEGDEVTVEKYLGADMHLAVIKDDWSEFVHAHPEGHDGRMMEDMHGHSFKFIQTAKAHGEAPESDTGMADEAINFRVSFPSAGLYRAYAQFRPTGSNLSPDEALVAVFWIRVEEQVTAKVSVQSQWWTLLLISLVLIALLSRYVKKYIGEEL